MKLRGAQVQLFQEALLDAFPNRGVLAQMVRFQLDENLDALVKEANLASIVFELITWAEARGKLEALLVAACTANPGNPRLRAFTEEIAGLMDNPSLLP